MDSYIAIALFLMTIIGFFTFIGLRTLEEDISSEKDILTHRIKDDGIFGDGMLSLEEEARLVNMSCDEIKDVFNTQMEICIYFRDTKRDIVVLSNGTHEKYGVGCGGIVINDVQCGDFIE